MTRAARARFFMARGSVSLCIQLFGTRDGLATRYAVQSGGCAGLTSCLAGRRRTSSANANAKQQVIAQRISDQFLERCSAHAALVVELCENPCPRRFVVVSSVLARF